jgi:hypothetical protein
MVWFSYTKKKKIFLSDLIFEKWVAQMAIFCLEIWLCPHESYCGLKRKKNSQFTYKNSKIISSGSIFSSTQHGVDVSNTYKDKYSERVCQTLFW